MRDDQSKFIGGFLKKEPKEARKEKANVEGEGGEFGPAERSRWSMKSRRRRRRMMEEEEEEEQGEKDAWQEE